MPTSWKFASLPADPAKGEPASYPAVREKIARLLIQYTLIESFFKFRRARQAYPFVLPQLLRPGSVVSSKEYGRHNSALVLLTDGMLPEKTRKNFRSRESNAVRKTNIEAVAPHLPGLDGYHRTMPSVEDADFPKLLRMLLPLDYALLIQNVGEEKPDFNLTHFHVRIERLTDSALRDLGIMLHYLEGGLYEKGEEFADLLEKKYFEYFNFYYNASGRKMAAANASQVLAKLPFAATVFIASQEDRRLSLLTSAADSSEVEIEQYVLLRLDKMGLEALREHCREHGLEVGHYLVMERAPHFGVGVLRVLYRHTEAGRPAADGILRPKINAREKWVKVVEENLVPVHLDGGAGIGCSLIYQQRYSLAKTPEASYLPMGLEGLVEEEMEEGGEMEAFLDAGS